MVAFALAGRFALAVAALLVYGGVRSLREPLYGAWIVPMIQPPQVRATVLSTVGQADAVGEVLGGPAIGLLVALTSPGLAIVAAGNAWPRSRSSSAACPPAAASLRLAAASLSQKGSIPVRGSHLVQGH
jgi:hypothetical protein